MNTQKAERPIATSLYFASAQTLKIFYTCPNCRKVENRLIERNLHYCYNCGQKFDWRVLVRVDGYNADLCKLFGDDYALQTKIIARINELNKTLNERVDDSLSYVCSVENFKKEIVDAVI